MLKCATRWSNVYQGGNMWAGWECYLSAGRDILNLSLSIHEKYKVWEECAMNGGFRVMHEEFCLVTDFPEILKVDEQNRPHSDIGPSHTWRDGWSLYHLHGVRVPEWLVMSPSRDLDPKLLLTNEELKNVDVRREFVRKVGIERCLDVLGWKVLDKRGDYELGITRVGENERRLLKMKNPSIGVWHIEAVHPECNTVQESLNYRAYGDKTKSWEPSILT